MTTVIRGTDNSVSAPAVSGSDGDTGLYFPAANQVALATNGTQAVFVDSSQNVGIGTSSPNGRLDITSTSAGANTNTLFLTNASSNASTATSLVFGVSTSPTTRNATIQAINAGGNVINLAFLTSNADVPAEHMRITSTGNVGIGTTSPASVSGANVLSVGGSSSGNRGYLFLKDASGNNQFQFYVSSSTYNEIDSQRELRIRTEADHMAFLTANTERARITSGGDFLVGKTAVSDTTKGFTVYNSNGETSIVYDAASGGQALFINRQVSDGTLINFLQANAVEGSISVSGNTVSYNGFSGGHWTQLQQGRGYNPDILRGTVMSSIGEMAEWKSVIWDEVIEHPAVPAVDAKEAVVDEEGNVIEPAIEAVEGKDAWTETIPHREAYLGQLPIGATFEEDGVTKTVVDDGNERLPKVKISDVVGDKAVYGVFQTWDEAQDMLVTSLGAFVVRIAAGVTVQIGDLLESNGDGCAKVQDDDVIRSKTIGKVTSTTTTATYDDGSYTVPCVIYCG